VHPGLESRKALVSVVGNVGDERVVIGSQRSADKLQRVGCTPSTGANLVLWHMRIPFFMPSAPLLYRV
jgi:hypothetical protein